MTMVARFAVVRFEYVAVVVVVVVVVDLDCMGVERPLWVAVITQTHLGMDQVAQRF